MSSSRSTGTLSSGAIVVLDDASLPITSTVVAYNTGLFYANTVIVPTGADYGIKVYTQYGGHVVIDINGYFAP